MKHRNLKKRILSGVLSFSIIAGSIPVVSLSASAADGDPARPLKENDPYYKSEKMTDLSTDSESEKYFKDSYYDNIVAESNKTVDLGRLPTVEDFMEKTDFEPSTFMSLSNFRKIYGTGGLFRAPESYDKICITNESELNLLSRLVNFTEEGESSDEQVFYSKAKYVLTGSIDMTETAYEPIGNADHPFDGEFDGLGCTINNLKMLGKKPEIYDQSMAFGIFGYIGTSGKVKNIELHIDEINLPYTVGAAIGGISGINKGTIENVVVLGTYDNTHGLVHAKYEVIASNATFGGITAENYGTVKNAFADVCCDIQNTAGSYTTQPLAAVNKGTLENAYYMKYEELSSYAVDSAVTFEEISAHQGAVSDDVLTYKKYEDNVTNRDRIGWALNEEILSKDAPYDYPGGYWEDYYDPGVGFGRRWIEPGTVTGEPYTVYNLDENGNRIPSYKMKSLTEDEILKAQHFTSDHYEETDEVDENGYNIGKNYPADMCLDNEFIEYIVNKYGSWPDGQYNDWTYDSNTGHYESDSGFGFKLKKDLFKDDSVSDDVYDEVNKVNKTLDGVYYEHLIPYNAEYVYIDEDAVNDEDNGVRHYSNTLQKDSFEFVVSKDEFFEEAASYFRSKYGYWLDSDDSEYDPEAHTLIYKGSTYVLDADGHPIQNVDSDGNLMWMTHQEDKYYEVYKHDYSTINGEGMYYSDIADSMDFGGLLQKGTMDYDTVNHGHVFLASELISNLSGVNEYGYSNSYESVDPVAYSKELYENYKDEPITIVIDSYVEPADGQTKRGSLGCTPAVMWSYLASIVNNQSFSQDSIRYGNMGTHSIITLSYTPNKWMQKLVSNANIYMTSVHEYYSNDWWYLSGPDGKSYVIEMDVYQNGNEDNYQNNTREVRPLIAMGTDEYPFNGTFDGGNAIIHMYQPSPLFGTIGEKGTVKNTTIYIEAAQNIVEDDQVWYGGESVYTRYVNRPSNYYDRSTEEIRDYYKNVFPSDSNKSVLCKTNNGTIDSAYVVGYITYDDFYGYAKVDPDGHNQPISDTMKEAFSGYFDGDNNFYAIAVNNTGTVSDSYVSVDLGITNGDIWHAFAWDGQYTSPCTSLADVANYISCGEDGVHYIKGAGSVKNNTGTVTEKAGMPAHMTYDELYDERYSSFTPDGKSPGVFYYDEKIGSFPTFKPYFEADDNGETHLKTSFDLYYFLNNACDGDVGILDNTIDMTGVVMDRPNPSAFTLKGTLTDENDICAYIDMKTGTKCYGIIGLDIAVPFGRAKFEDLYFIGGTIIIDKSYYWGDTQWIVNEANNVHVSSHYSIRNIEYNTRINYSDRLYSQAIDSFANYADHCTYSGLIGVKDLNSVGTEYRLNAIGRNCYYCTSWGSIRLIGDTIKAKKDGDPTKDYNNDMWSNDTLIVNGVGSFVKYSSSHFDINKTTQDGANVTTRYSSSYPYYRHHQIHLLGDHCHNCKIDGEYDYSGFNANTPFDCKYLFGLDAHDCVFNGTYTSSQPWEFFSGGEGFVFTEDAVANGVYKGVSGINGVLFKGTINVSTNANDVFAVGTNCKYGIARGVINVDNAARVYGVGTSDPYFIADNEINFVNSVGANNPEYTVIAYGSTKDDDYTHITGVNYTDCVYNDGYTKVNLAWWAFVGGRACVNYGKTDVNVNIIKGGCIAGGLDSVNFGDYKAVACSYDSRIYIMSNCKNKSRNYGNIDLEVYDLYFTANGQNMDRYSSGYSLSTSDSYDNFNAGDVKIKTYGTTFAFVARDAYNYGDIEVLGGDQAAADINVYGSSSQNYGNIYVHDTNTSVGNPNADICVYGVYSESDYYYNKDIVAHGSIKVENCTAGLITRVAPARIMRTPSDKRSVLCINTDCPVDVLNSKMFGCDISGSVIHDTHYSWYSSTIANHKINANVNVNIDGISVNKNSNTGHFYIYGVVGYEHDRNRSLDGAGTAEIYAKGSVSVKNLSAVDYGSYPRNLNVRIFPTFSYETTLTKFDNKDLSLSVDNVTTTGDLIVANSNYYSNECLVNDGSINVTNSNAANVEVIGGIYKASSSLINKANVSVYNTFSEGNMLVIGGCSTFAAKDAELHNFGNVTVAYDNNSDKVLKGNIGIAGVVAFGNNYINVDDPGSPKAFMSNAGKIKFDSDILIDAVASDTDATKIHIGGVHAGFDNVDLAGSIHDTITSDATESTCVANAVNTGDIDVTILHDKFIKLKVGGVVPYANRAFSLINWGNITINHPFSPDGQQRRYYVTAVASARRCSGLVNYGNISANEGNRDYKILGVGAKEFSDSINYGNIDNDTFVHGEMDVVVDMSGNIRAIPSDMEYGHSTAYVAGITHERDERDKISMFAMPYVWAAQDVVNPDYNPPMFDMWQRFRVGYALDYDTMLFDYLNEDIADTNNKWYISQYAHAKYYSPSQPVTADMFGDYSDYYEYSKVLGSGMIVSFLENFDYSNLIDPAFTLRYRGPMAVAYYKYQKSNSMIYKIESGNHTLRYADMDQLNGLTADYFTEHYGDYDGAFVVDMTVFRSFDPRCYVQHNSGVGTEVHLFSDTNIKDSHGETMKFDEYRSSLIQTAALTQAYYDTKGDNYIESVEEFDTDNGGKAHLKSVSSLISHQSPIDGDHDGEYSKYTHVTVEDLYIPVNGFGDAIGKTAQFELHQGTAGGCEFKLFSSIPQFSDYETAAIWVERKLEDETDTMNSRAVTTSTLFNVKIPDVDESIYYVVGNCRSGDERRNNILILGIHGTSRAPSAELVKLGYPTAISTSQDSFVYSYYDASAISEFDTEMKKAESVRFGEYEYPVYTLSDNMIHTTDGSLSKPITTTGDVYMSINAKDIDDLIFYVNDGENIYFAKATLPTAQSYTSSDGVNIIKILMDSSVLGPGASVSGDNGTGEAIEWYKLKDGTISTAEGSAVAFSTNSENNPMLKSGHKTITVATDTGMDEVVKLFQIEVDKNVSYEDYIRSHLFGRHDNLTRDSSSDRVDNLDVGPAAIQIEGSYFSRGDFAFSTFATSEYDNQSEYQDQVIMNDEYIKAHPNEYRTTNYPSVVYDQCTVTAEDGSKTTYSHKYVMPKIDVASIKSIYNSAGTDYPMSPSEPFLIVTANVPEVDMTVRYNDVAFRQDIESRGFTAYLDCVYVYRDGKYYTTLRADRDHVCSFNDGTLTFHSDSIDGIHVIGENFDRETFPQGIFTFTPVMNLGSNPISGMNSYLTLDSFDISGELLSDHRLISGVWQNTKMTSVISTERNDISENVYMDEKGVIDYTNTPEDAQHFYITNTVEPNCESDTFTVKVPMYSTLYEKVDGIWVPKFKAGGSDNTVYSESRSYTPEELGAGVVTEYMITAQNYNATDVDRGRDKLVSYYTTIISAQVRNKYFTIDFNTDDAETAQAYSDIINSDGNISVEIKNMNGSNMNLHQTKIYKDNSDLESNYYPVTQGDYAIDVNVPEGYEAKVRIRGSSSEGYLRDYPLAIGKRIRLPYANEQHLNLEVYLVKKTPDRKWGVNYNKTLYKTDRQNTV